VADRLLVDLGPDGLVTVGTWPEGGLPETVWTAPGLERLGFPAPHRPSEVSYTATSSSALVAHLNNRLKLSQAEPEKPAYLPRSSTSSSNDMLVRRQPPGAKAKVDIVAAP
jgi:hypothetical protein